MINKSSKNKILGDIHVLCHLVAREFNKKMNFGLFCKTASCIGKMALIFAYNVRKKCIIYQNDPERRLHPN
jgi:hypothetical protein